MGHIPALMTQVVAACTTPHTPHRERNLSLKPRSKQRF